MATDPKARLAVEMFACSARKQIGAMAAVLGGLNLLFFTGGIGENDAATRAKICEGLTWIGSRVLVVASEEAEQIARHAYSVMAASQAGPAPS